jgi:pimeloyl-ACP methyl ester carboxylesterase
VLGLVLASSPGPAFAPDASQLRYLRHPVALAPLFAATAPRRLGPEIRVALPRWSDRWRYSREQLWRIARAPMSPRLMARRIEAALREDFMADCARVSAPTLVLTGEPELDRVVPVASSREYLHAIPGSRHQVVPRTGHLGVVTAPQAWGAAVGTFARRAAAGARHTEVR